MAQTGTAEYPLYNTTFTLHRLSALHTSSDLPINTAILNHHSHRFREIIVGDVLRGVRVGLTHDGVVAAGPLQKVSWRLLPQEKGWNGESVAGAEVLDETTGTIQNSRGIWISIEYERAVYTGILLKGATDNAGDGFEHFPLLMTRMTGALRDALIYYLENTFDARASSLRLSSTQISSKFESYLKDVSQEEDGSRLQSAERIRAIRNIVKETEVFIGFKIASDSGALRNLEVHLTREDIPKLLSRGASISNEQSNNAPFIQALSAYLKGHLALNLKHDGVQIVRIACGAFVLGAEGKIKLTEPAATEVQEQHARATANLVQSLIDFAAVNSLSDGYS